MKEVKLICILTLSFLAALASLLGVLYFAVWLDAYIPYLSHEWKAYYWVAQ